MKKYGLLVYPYISVYQNTFDVISLPWDFVETWPTSPPIEVTDKQGQTQYQWPNTVFFKVVEDADWDLDQDTDITAAVTSWNADVANVNRQIPNSLQLVFEDSEKHLISTIFEAERERLINELP